MFDSIRMTEKQIYNIIFKVFASMGYSKRECHYGADVLASADAWGVDTHGLARLPMFYGMYTTGSMINLNAKLTVMQESPSSVSFDAQNGMGPIMAPQAMERCIEKAKETGICAATVMNGGHVSMVGYYTRMATNQRLIGLFASNSLVAMFPFGGRERIMGNSPWSLAFPPGKKYTDSIMLDMASSAVAFGKLQNAIRAGQEIPYGWAVDNEGRDTHDPYAVLDDQGSLRADGGALAPFGGVKGYCLSVMLEMLTSVLSGSAFAPEIGTADWNTGKNPSARKEYIGNFMLVMNPAKFRPIDEFTDSIDEYAAMIKNCKPATGVGQVYLPGELEAIQYHKRKEKGIEMNAVIAEQALDICKDSGLLKAEDGIEDMIRKLG